MFFCKDKLGLSLKQEKPSHQSKERFRHTILVCSAIAKPVDFFP